MTFAIERHCGATYLVLISDDPGDADSVKLARFVNDDAVAAWTETYNRALLMSREIGRMGLA